MSQSVVFRTPGLIDLRAFTIFGVSAKPNSDSPIGFFGTGLKYAIAVLLRTNPKRNITLWRGMEKYTFRQADETFRDKDFTSLTLRRDKGLFFKDTELPFTLELGKTWELWMAFRELYSNTLDEDGAGYVFTDAKIQSERDMTYLVVEGDDFVQEYHEREKTFLLDALRSRPLSGESVQVFKRASNHIYYRGLRVRDLEHPALVTYNILSQVALTEDRTAKYDWEIDNKILQFTSQSTEDEALITTTISAPTTTFEGKLDWDSHAYHQPSEVFKHVIEAHHNKYPAAVNESARKYIQSWLPKEPEPEEPATIENLIERVRHEQWEQARDLMKRIGWLQVTRVLELGNKALKQQEADESVGTSGYAMAPNTDELVNLREKIHIADDEIPF